MDLDHQLCYCFHITKRKIVNFVRQTRPKKASLISECFGAGSGCGWCIPFLEKIQREIVGGDKVVCEELTPQQYEAMRKKYMEAVQDGTATRHHHAAQPDQTDLTSYFSRSRPDPDPDAAT